jgi:hypothetical protein
MNELARFRSSTVPDLAAAAGDRASMRFLEFSAANIRNPQTRRAYARAAEEFLARFASAGVALIGAVQPVKRRHLDRGRPGRVNSRHRASSNGWPRSATCLTVSSPVRWCQSTRPRKQAP